MICFALAIILLVIVGAFIYLNIYGKPLEIKEGPPFFTGGLEVAYKYARGSYSGTRAFLNEVAFSFPDAIRFTLFYDNPDNTMTTNLRWLVGLVVAKNGVREVPEYGLEVFPKFRYTLADFPAINSAVCISFECPFLILLPLLRYRVTCALRKFSKKRGIYGGPLMEFIRGNCVEYVLPLEKEGEFTVPEAQIKKK